MKLRTKLFEELEVKLSLVYQKICVLLKEIWQGLKAHTAFFLSTAVLPTSFKHFHIKEDLTERSFEARFIISR